MRLIMGAFSHLQEHPTVDTLRSVLNIVNPALEFINKEKAKINNKFLVGGKVCFMVLLLLV